MKILDKVEACCAEAVELGYFTEALLKKHQIGWLGRWSFMFSAKRSTDWEYWYHHAQTGVDFSWKDVIDLQVDRKGLELRWCPAGEYKRLTKV